MQNQILNIDYSATVVLDILYNKLSGLEYEGSVDKT